MKYKIFGTVMQTLNFELNKGESVYSESGKMSWMSDNIKLTTSTKNGIFSGIKRKLSGESFFLNTFTAEEGPGIITFSGEFPGKIIPLKLSGKKTYILQKDAFMCAQESVKLDMHFRKRLGSGFFGGEGFILNKVSGKGMGFAELAGEITEITLKKGQVLKVDTGHIAMFEETVDFDVEFVKGIKNILFAGEGLFLARLTGPGTVWLQSMPLPKFASKILQYLPFRGR